MAIRVYRARIGFGYLTLDSCVKCFGEYNLYPASDKMKDIRPECIYSGLLGLEGLL